jgi:hypothetical protein
MTGQEMERAIAFVLEQQAQLTATVGRMSEKVDLMAEKVDLMAEKVDGLTDKVDRNADSAVALLAIAEIHEREITELRQTQAEAHTRTDERLNALINTVERHISEGRNGKT